MEIFVGTYSENSGRHYVAAKSEAAVRAALKAVLLNELKEVSASWEDEHTHSSRDLLDKCLKGDYSVEQIARMCEEEAGWCTAEVDVQKVDVPDNAEIYAVINENVSTGAHLNLRETIYFTWPNLVRGLLDRADRMNRVYAVEISPIFPADARKFRVEMKDGTAYSPYVVTVEE